jgi:hypothetical protein
LLGQLFEPPQRFVLQRLDFVSIKPGDHARRDHKRGKHDRQVQQDSIIFQLPLTSRHVLSLIGQVERFVFTGRVAKARAACTKQNGAG